MSDLDMALLAAQEDCKGLSKDGNNKFGKFNYSSIEEVVKTCRGLLHKQGLIFFPEEQTMHTEGPAVYVSQKYCLKHVKSGETQAITRTMVIPPEMGDMSLCQIQGAAESYMLKNVLREVLLLPRFDAKDDLDSYEQPSRTAGNPSRRFK